MKKLLMVMFMLFSSLAEAEPHIIGGIEIDQDNYRYRVIFTDRNEEGHFYYNENRLVVPTRGLAPTGAAVYVLNKSGEYIEPTINGYASAKMSSNMLFREPLKKFKSGERIVSEWYELKNLFSGIRLLLPETNHPIAKDWAKYKISFTMEFADAYVSFESDWINFDSHLRKEINKW